MPKAWKVIDAEGDVRMGSEERPFRSHEAAQCFCDHSFEQYGEHFPQEYPFTIIEFWANVGTKFTDIDWEAGKNASL